MNLHDINPARQAWLWTKVQSLTTWRTLGNHAYEYDEGTPPPLREFTAGGGQTRTPDRFRWRPYYTNMDEMRANRPVALCGYRSRPGSSRFEFSQDWNRCQDCRRVSRDRGIIVTTIYEAQENNETYARIQNEFRGWLAR